MTCVSQAAISIHPVGVVVSDFQICSRKYDYTQESLIYMREDLAEALIGLEYFSHLHVIYYQHRREDWLKLVQWEQAELPLTLPVAGEVMGQGVYSTRSPARPSALGSSVVEIIKIEGNCIHVRGLDALDGSPVLDIKTYIPQYDAFPWAEIPLNWGAGNALRTTSRQLHWDTSNAVFTLGLKTGSKALHYLGISRGKALSAAVNGGHFFAQGIEAATGCSVLRNTMNFHEVNGSSGQWSLILTGINCGVEIKLNELACQVAHEVLDAADEELFASIRRIEEHF